MTVIQSLRAGDLDEVARHMEVLQRDPAQFTGNLPVDAAAIAEALRSLPGGVACIVVAVGAGRPVGLLGADHATDPPRVWWQGPFVWGGEGWRAVSDRLYTSARRRLPPQVTQEEFGPDERNARVQGFARAHGFHAEAASAVLVLDEPLPDPAGDTVVPITEEDHPELARLHDRLFPEASSAGEALVEVDDPARVALGIRRAGGLVGYVIVQCHAGGDGTVECVGVRPDLRGRGHGRTLVLAGVHWLQRRGCAPVHLTIREDLRAGRALYAAVGFAEERLVRPWRKGFTLDRPAGEV